MNSSCTTRRLFAIAVLAMFAFGMYLLYRGSLGGANSTDEAAPSSQVTRAGSDRSMSLPTVPLSTRQEERLSEAERGLDPSASGWQTESLSDAAGSQLKILALSIERGDRAQAQSVVTRDFHCTPLRPADLEIVFGDDVVVVRRPLSSKSLDGERRSLKSLDSAVADLPAANNPNDCHVKFKIVGVETAHGSAQTVVYAEGFGSELSGQKTQWTATWNCEWLIIRDASPKLTAIDVVKYEEVESLANSTHWLRDDTERVFGADAGYQQQLAHGMDHWLGRLSGRLGVSRLGHNGIAIGDVNGDNRPDIYVCQSGGLPNRLYIQQPDGTVRDLSVEAGVDYLDDTTCALLVDLDNDGDQDLTLATISGGLVLSNDGAGRFTQAAYLPECRNAFSLTAADYDQDSLLDLYIGRYWPSAENRGEIPIPVPYFDGQNGGSNVLLKNQGELEFSDVTEAVGLNVDNTRYTMAAAWSDLDQDGDVDLYVANDFGKNCLYENDGGRFRNIASSARVEDIASGMSVTFSDTDHDGHTDIYVSNMFSSAGNRIAYQRQYEGRFDDNGVNSLRRMARGNSLFRGSGDGSFQDASISSATTMGRWSWGSLFADINNDGWDDLLVANGNITAEKLSDL